MDYDVCLSFADEDRVYVDAVAGRLRQRAVKVFYDGHEEAYLWGKDLIQHLDHVYRFAARYCVVFVSSHYVRKAWTRHEQRSAQARAFLERSEYLLPARFDDTELPGLPPTVRYVDLRERTPEGLADLLCEKLRQSAVAVGDDTEGQIPAVSWFEPPRLALGTGADRIIGYQGMSMTPHTPQLTGLVDQTMRTLAELAQPADGALYWTCHQDRYFDRLYATSAVATALRQLGVGEDAALLGRAEAYLRRSSPGSIDDRAATAHLLVSGNMTEDHEIAFIDTLAPHQAPPTDASIGGSFLLPQGPALTGSRPNWSAAPVHADGASFHACHVADVLLHLPPEHGRARARAEPLLAGVRSFLARSLAANSGWLVDLAGRRTPLTVYAFCVCPALSVPLPSDWRDIALGAMELLTEERYGLLARCFGVMNVWYLVSVTRDMGYRAAALPYVVRVLSDIERATTSADAREVGAVQRAILCGVNLVDERFGPHATVAARASAHAVERLL